MGKIQELATFEKPREKAERFGIDKISDEELLAIIINCGTVGMSSLDIAKSIINDAGSLAALVNVPFQYFSSFRGIKKVSAIKLAASVELARRINERQRLVYEEKVAVNSDSLFHRYSITLAGLTQEVLIIVILNKNKQIIYENTLYRGDDNNLTINHRDIMRLLLLHNGYYYYLIHNHPNDTVYPSESDMVFTRKIMEKTKEFNAKLLDHLIISRESYYSILTDRLFSFS